MNECFQLAIAIIAILIFFFSQEGAQQFPSFEAEQSFKTRYIFLEVLLGFFWFVVVFGVIEHGSAHTVLSLLAHEYLIVYAAFAAGPKGLILCKL